MNAPDHADTEPLKTTTSTAGVDAPADAASAAMEAGPAPTSATAPQPGADEQIAAAKKDAAEHYERYLRTVADMENLRRRTVREKDELRQFAASRVLEDLLPIMDNLGLGLVAAKAPNADLKTLVGGISMVAEQFKTTLAGHGLKEINPVGQAFDPNLHEAISQVPSEAVAEGSVVQVVRTGYSLNGRLLRPASVIISTGPVPTEAASA